MKSAILLAAAGAVLLLAVRSQQAGGEEKAVERRDRDGGAPPAARTAVLLELYTSEGCSSCPPADRLLEELAGADLAPGVDVVPLSLHVDYWNHLGWKDPYSDAEYSRRQERYADVLPSGRVYTPQLVVDGAVHMVGSGRREVLAAIADASERRKAAVTLRSAPSTSATPATATETPAAWRGSVSIDAASLTSFSSKAELFVAVTEDGLASSVSRGENAGSVLRHVAVVRGLRPLGRLQLDAGGRATREVAVELDRSWNRERLHVVAWIADGPQGRVLGAARLAL